MSKGKRIAVPPKEELQRMYQEEKKSYREIMKYYNVNSARAVKKWLEYYDIPIRHGNEAIKAQWEGNDERRRQIGEIFSECHKNKPSNRRLSDSEVKEEYMKNGYTLLQREVIDGYSIVTLECEKGHIFKQSFKNKGYKGCPICKKSKGEKAIQAYLKEKGICYTRQFRDERCSSVRPLPFDFGIIQNDKVIALIEYDGEYHYKAIFSEEDLEKQQKRDAIKTKFCEENRIPLLRIKYNEDLRGKLEDFVKGLCVAQAL